MLSKIVTNFLSKMYLTIMPIRLSVGREFLRIFED